MTSYLSSWFPSFSRPSESEQVANTESGQESESRDQTVELGQAQDVNEDTKAGERTADVHPSAALTSRLEAPEPKQPQPTFKVPTIPPTRSTPPKQHIPSSSSLVPPPVPSRLAPSRYTPATSESKELEEDIDAAPQFPLPDSAQRSRSRPAAPPSVPSFDVRPPSPDQDEEDTEPASDLNIAVLPGTIPLGNMAPPPSTTARPAFGMQAGSGGSGPAPVSKAKRREKVALAPGYSPLDWARLTQSGRNLRGVEGPKRVTAEELQKHNTPYDAWMALDGIVYNITPYVRFHPGGGKELLRGAGRDGTKLFMNTHSWVNYTHMLQECIVGPLVRS